jgi:ankyrin repeat protein
MKSNSMRRLVASPKRAGWRSCCLYMIAAIALACSDGLPQGADHFSIAKHGTLEQTQLLVEAGHDLNVSDALGWTPLFYSINRLQYENLRIEGVAQYMIDQGARVDAVANSGETALHVAGWSGATEVVGYLIAHGGDPSQLDHSGKAPIFGSIMRNRPETLREFIGGGADI